MGTDFPAGIDDFGSASEHELVRASHINDIRLAIEALENEVGVRGSTVADSLRYKIDKQQCVTVAKSGGQYTSIQDAIDSITDASGAKRYVIYIYPGDYAENIDFTGKPHISLFGVGDRKTPVRMRGTTGTLVTFETACSVSISNMSLQTTGTRTLYVPLGGSVDDSISLTNCNVAVVTTTARQMAKIYSGSLEMRNCRLLYHQSGNTVGV